MEITTENPSLAVLQVGLASEAHGNETLSLLVAKVTKQTEAIDDLLDLSQELTTLPENQDSHDLTDKMLEQIQGLNEKHDIQIWKGGDKITKEKLSEMKAQIGSQVDKLRTAFQTTISTKIQPMTTNMQSMNNIVQQIIQRDDKMKSKAQELRR